MMTAAVSFKGVHGIEGVGINSAIFKAIAANDVSRGVSNIVGGLEVDREQILSWNPEIIFLDTGGLELVKQDYAKTRNSMTSYRRLKTEGLSVPQRHLLLFQRGDPAGQCLLRWGHPLSGRICRHKFQGESERDFQIFLGWTTICKSWRKPDTAIRRWILMPAKVADNRLPKLKAYDQFIRRKRITFLVAIAATIVTAFFAIGKGSLQIGLPQILQAFFGQGAPQIKVAIMGIRLPRVIAAITVGASLAVSGAVMQCVLQNPLASASTLGVSQGASFGAALGIIAFGGGVVNSNAAATAIAISNPFIVTICAFLFGLLTTGHPFPIPLRKDGAAYLAGAALSSRRRDGVAAVFHR